MEKSNVFQIMEFVEDIKDRLNNIEYKNIMDILQKSYKEVENARKLYDLRYSLIQCIETVNIENGEKNVSRNIIDSTCLIRLTSEENDTLRAISLKRQEDINYNDLEKMYEIIYLVNNVNFFNLFEIDMHVSENKQISYYKLNPEIKYIREAKNIESDEYKFSFSYSYDKNTEETSDDSDLEMYTDCYLSVFITARLSREDLLFIETNINDIGLKLLIQNIKDISFKITNEKGEIVKEEDEMFKKLQFSYIEFLPFIEYNNERYYLYLFDFCYE